jgi:hypothetical protein
VRVGLALLCAALVVTAVGCRAPGEPPSHPDQGAYRDLIRRELGAAQSALGTSVLTLRYLDDGRVPRAYGRVMLRQAANDLRKVAQDLGEVTPPAGVAATQTRMLRLTLRDQRLLERLDAGSPAGRRAARGALSTDADTLGTGIASVLDPS